VGVKFGFPYFGSFVLIEFLLACLVLGKGLCGGTVPSSTLLDARDLNSIDVTLL
jgi:hypothetical protein